MWCLFRLVAVASLLFCFSAKSFSQLFPVTVGQNFTGTTQGLSTAPPDTMGAAGIDHFVELHNHRFHVYNKSDGSVVQSITDTAFWTNSGITPTGNSFDPRIVYDPHARRWYAVAVDNAQNPNNFLFAVSNTSDPSQTWTGFKIDNDSFDTHWGDFPMLGYTGEGIYISVNMVSLTTPNPQTTFLVLPKFDLLQPVPSIANMTLIEHVPRATTGFSPQPAVDASNTFGVGMPFLSMEDVVAGTLMQSSISTPGAPAIGGVITTTIPGAANPPTVDQPGPAQNIQANDARFSANTVVHNGQLYAVHSIEDMGLAAVRFMRTDVQTGTVLENSIIVDPMSRALTFPSIAVNEFDNVVIGVTGTSTTEYASSYAMIGKTVGGITSFDVPMLLKAGTDEYVRLDSLGRNRWGDYSATTVDPADPSIFWTVQEFVHLANNAGTQVTELIVPQSNEARWANTVSNSPFDDPTMWQTSHGGLPQPLERLVFSRAPDPAGISMTINFPFQPPGTYVYDSASIRQGDIRFELNGNLWEFPTFFEVGPYSGHPRVTVANGILASVDGNIASRPTSEGHMTLDNATWHVANELTIGSDVAPGSAGLLPGAFGGTGSLTINNNSHLTVGSRLKIWQQGTVNLFDGSLTASVIENSHPLAFNFAGGILHVDTFAGELHNMGGRLAPGIGFGATNVLLGYVQGPSATLEIEIGGTGPGSFDQLIVAGPADFDGVLDVVLTAGYSPTLGDTFDIVHAGLIPLPGLARLLSHSTLPSLGRFLNFHLFYDPTVLTLAAVPSLTGDYNADGLVDAADFNVWRNMLGSTGIGLAADGNLDRIVDNFDLLLWRANFGAVAPGAGTGTEVPEPSGVMLYFSALVWLACRKRA